MSRIINIYMNVCNARKSYNIKKEKVASTWAEKMQIIPIYRRPKFFYL